MKREMSDNFYAALGEHNIDNAIKLYDKEINEIDPKNFAAWNNRGKRKVEKGLIDKDRELINDGIEDFKQAISLANEIDDHGFKGAEDNITWANEVLKEL